jgi:hypothetical protein
MYQYRSKTTNTNVRIVPKTSYGSRFGCFKSELVSKDTLLSTLLLCELGWSLVT